MSMRNWKANPTIWRTLKTDGMYISTAFLTFSIGLQLAITLWCMEIELACWFIQQSAFWNMAYPVIRSTKPNWQQSIRAFPFVAINDNFPFKLGICWRKHFWWHNRKINIETFVSGALLRGVLARHKLEMSDWSNYLQELHGYPFKSFKSRFYCIKIPHAYECRALFFLFIISS